MSDSTEMLQIKGYKISPDLFTLGYAANVGPYHCNSKCCQKGAYVDVLERDIVFAHADMIKEQMDETQSLDTADWFETEIRVDHDYKSGTCVGTGTVNNKCAMMDKRGWCSIQVAATANGMHKWAIKPLYCYLFPIELIDGVLRFDNRWQDKFTSCSVYSEFEVPLFQACKDELETLIGADGYALLQAHYEVAHAKTQVMHMSDVGGAPAKAKAPAVDAGLVQLKTKK